MAFVLHINGSAGGHNRTEVDWAAATAGGRENTSALKL
jgi:hypothetical protein